MRKKDRIHILFLCTGNICRSPMAEYIFKDLVEKAGMESGYVIDSAGCSDEEEGNALYPPAQKVLSEHGIPFGRHRARQVTEEDMRRADHVIVMDSWNLRSLGYRYGKKYADKTRRMLSFCGEDDTDVSDPWYTRDFETAYREILRGCEALLRYTGRQI